MRALLFGAGEGTRQFLRACPAARRIEIVGIVDNDRAKWGSVLGGDYTVESPERIRQTDWDRIIVTPYLHHEIMEQLQKEYGIERDQMLKPGDLIVPEQANLGTVGLDCDYDKCYEMNELVPDKVIPSNKMEEFYLKRNHRIMNKWWHYFEIYDTFLHKYADSDVRFLEIGVFRGGSMQMWRDYFGEKATIVGIDIDESCRQFEEGNVHICIGSQADPAFLREVSGKWGPFDAVLDDGSHMMEHQILTFETLFPLLKEGGVYLCEDCQCCYSPRYGGGYLKKDSFIEYSKNFADCVNSQFVEFEKADRLPSYAQYVKACHYYDSMVVVEKKRRGYSFFTEFGR